MKILYEEQFVNSLKNIVLYISKDKKVAAKKFQKDLLNTLPNILKHPKMYRQSFYSDDENYRDIFKWQNR